MKIKITRPHTSSIGIGLTVVLAVFLLGSGCASTEVKNRDAYSGGRLPKPARIIVHDYAATPDDIPEWAEGHAAYANAVAEMSEDELKAARSLGADISKELVHEINKTGMVAVRSEGQPEPQVDDLVLVGYLTSVDEGSSGKRVLIGFGEGAASIEVHAEGYRMTEEGLVRLGGGEVEGHGGKSPGLVVPTVVTIATHNPIGLAVSGAAKIAGEASGKSGAKGDVERIADEIAKVLKSRFQEQDWI